ncbi:MAG: hypothetical protein R6U97_06480 [Desulfosalsimonas sp.]
MGSGIYSALSGGLAKMRQMETAVHDLANANKTGYKAGGMAFESMVDGNMQNTGANGMNFCRTSNRFIDFSLGLLVRRLSILLFETSGETLTIGGGP